MYEYFSERDYAKDFPYTDLATERRRADVDLKGVDFKREAGLYGSWERIRITSPEGARCIGRPMGIYDTLLTERMDLIDEEGIEDASEEIARELCYLFDVGEIIPERILVVGLGNPRLSPDAIGVESAGAVKATMHIKSFDEALFRGLECSEIAVCIPGVASVSGMDASVSVRGICDAIRPNAVIAIDSLASRSVKRLGRTVQISNTGIFPGSGIGGLHSAINKGTVGVPVISIGVPTVIDSRMFWLDAGGSRSETEGNELAGASMFVAPKEINGIVESGAKIIGGAINQAFGLYA